MAINKHREHLVVYLEDSPYKDLMNGVRTMPQVDANKIESKQPLGGWPKIFFSLEENLKLLERFPKMHVLLLMDFDHQFDDRMNKFKQILVDTLFESRVFLLGIDNKEFENLKQTLKHSNGEQIGQELIKGCPDQVSKVWHNKHLACNLTEIKRMKEIGLFEWLFKN